MRIVHNRLLRLLRDHGTVRIQAGEINLTSHHGRRRVNGICRKRKESHGKKRKTLPRN